MKTIDLRFRKKLITHLYNYLVSNYLSVLKDDNNVNYITIAMREHYDEMLKELKTGATVYLPYRLILKDKKIDRDTLRVANISLQLSEDQKSLTVTATSKLLFNNGDTSVTSKTDVIDLSKYIRKQKHFKNVCIDVDNTRIVKSIIKELFSTTIECDNIDDDEDDIIMDIMDDDVQDLLHENTDDITSDNSSGDSIGKFVSILNEYQDKFNFSDIPEQSSYNHDEAYIRALSNYAQQKMVSICSVLEDKLSSLYRKYKWLFTITNEINNIYNVKTLGELNYYIRFLNIWKYTSYYNDVAPFCNILDYICKGYLLAESKLEEYTSRFDNYFLEQINIPINTNNDLLQSICENIISSNYIDIKYFDTQIYDYLRDKLVLYKSGLQDHFNVYRAIAPIYREVTKGDNFKIDSDILKSIERYRDVGSSNKLFEQINALNIKYRNK